MPTRVLTIYFNEEDDVIYQRDKKRLNQVARKALQDRLEVLKNGMDGNTK